MGAYADNQRRADGRCSFSTCTGAPKSFAIFEKSETSLSGKQNDCNRRNSHRHLQFSRHHGCHRCGRGGIARRRYRRPLPLPGSPPAMATLPRVRARGPLRVFFCAWPENVRGVAKEHRFLQKQPLLFQKRRSEIRSPYFRNTVSEIRVSAFQKYRFVVRRPPLSAIAARRRPRWLPPALCVRA